MRYENGDVLIINSVIDVKALLVFFALVLMTARSKRYSFVLKNSLHSSFTNPQCLLIPPIKSPVG